MIVVSRKFVIGIACYLNQAALSLDRVPAEDLTPLQEYYKDNLHPHPCEVLAKLRTLNHDRCPANQFQGEVHLTVWQWFSLAYDVLTWRSVIIRFPILCLVEITLQHYDRLLSTKATVSRSEMMDVRLELAYTGALIVPLIRPLSKRTELGSVDHLNHADHVAVRQIEEIAGNNWLG